MAATPSTCADCGACAAGHYEVAPCAAGNASAVGRPTTCAAYSVSHGGGVRRPAWAELKASREEATLAFSVAHFPRVELNSDWVRKLPALCSRGVSGAARASAMDGCGGAR